MYKIKRFILNILKFLYIQKFKFFTETSLKQITNLISLLRPVLTNLELERIGGIYDGGYLIPKGLIADVVVSPGVSASCDFEYHFANLGATCYLFDYSIEEPPKNHSNFTFYKKFWGLENTKTDINCSNWLNTNLNKENLNILQMDIEGCEIILLQDENYLKQTDKFDVMVIEFHKFENILNKKYYDYFFNIFNKLLKNFQIIHFHQNNNLSNFKFHGLDVISDFEITFINRNQKKISYTVIGNKTFDFHPLDSPNVRSRDDIKPNW
jgi:hypothetical protein